MYFNFCSFCILILPSTHTVFNFLRVLFLAFSSSLCSLLCFMHICTYMQMIRIISGNFPRILRSILDLFPKPIFSPNMSISIPYLWPCPRHILLCWPTSPFLFYSKYLSSALTLNLPQDGYHLLSSPSAPQSLFPCFAVILIALYHS